MSGTTTRRAWRARTARLACAWLACAWLAGALPAVGQEAPAAPDPVEEASQLLARAAKLGARRDLPTGYRALEKRVEEARRQPPTSAQAQDLVLAARLLASRAAFVAAQDEARSTVEAIATRFDAALQEIAGIEGVPLDRGLSGAAAAEQLVSLLSREAHARQVRLDALRVQVATLQELSGGRVAAQDSLITSLRVEISDLRRRLWEAELRAGMAEADRSAAESALVRRQDREQAVRDIGADLGEANGSVLILPSGEIVLQVHGLQFGVGSAQLAAGQGGLVDKLAAAVKRFPGATVRVEGHTDDTGARAANLELSRKRAATVAAALARRLDVPPETIATVGHGPDRPIATNATDAGRARNRRIDVVIVPAS